MDTHRCFNVRINWNIKVFFICINAKQFELYLLK